MLMLVPSTFAQKGKVKGHSGTEHESIGDRNRKRQQQKEVETPSESNSSASHLPPLGSMKLALQFLLLPWKADPVLSRINEQIWAFVLAETSPVAH